MSIYNDILDAVVTQIKTLDLVDDDQVQKRKLPKAQERLDALDLIAVAPGADDGEKLDHIDFDSHDWRYPIDIVIITDGDGNYVTGLDTTLDWRQQIRGLFDQPTFTGVSSVWDMEVDPEPALDRSVLADNYEYSPLRLYVHSIEAR